VAYAFGAQNSANQGDSASRHITPTLDKSKIPAVTVALRGREGGATAELGGEVATALRASSGGGDKPHVLTPTVYSIMPQNSGKDYKARPVEVAQPVMAGGPVGGNQGGDYVLQSAVRRLTPVECERLQGFPDNYTAIPWRGQPPNARTARATRLSAIVGPCRSLHGWVAVSTSTCQPPTTTPTRTPPVQRSALETALSYNTQGF